MAVEQSPNPRDIQDFQFKLLAHLRLSQGNPQLPLKQSLSLLTSASKFGLIFIGTSTGFDVIQTARIVEQCAEVKKPTVGLEVADFPRRSVRLGGQPSHLDVSCDCQYLAVASVGVIRVYDVTSFTAQFEKVVQEVRVMSPVQVLSWNPGIANMLAAITQDGSASVYEFKNNTFEINSIPPEAQATCLCWSPKGKQIVIGSKNGSLNQFKPELKIVKSIPPPQGDWSLVSVHWLSNFQYAAVYSPQGQQRPSLVVVNTPKNPPTITYINYDDITYSNGENRTNQFYFIHQQAWNVLLVASANSMEVGVLGRTGEAPWEQWQMEDAARALLPFSPSRQETHPVGMAIDTSPQYNLPWGENQHLPPMPLLLLLSHEGLLTLYWCVNLQPGSASVCVPPTPLPDTSGLHLFVSASPPSIPVPAQQQTQQLPQKSPSVAASSQSAFSTSTPPVSFAPPAPAPASTLSFGPATVAPTAQWQQPPAASQPAWTVPALSATQSENKPMTSWMSPPPSFVAAVSPISAFSVAAAVSTANTPSTAFAAQPLGIAPSEGFAKPAGAFVQSSVSVVSKPSPVVTSVSPIQVPATLEFPAASFPAQPPTTVPTPEPEVTEESEQLQRMNEALIQDSIREEIDFCNKELHELKQRALSLNVNALNDAVIEKLTADTEEMSSFMRELKETTDVEASEVDYLRSFMLQSFSYVESMRRRLRLETNPDYVSIQTSQGLDPIQARKMADIRSNVQFIDCQLNKLSEEVVERWGAFQETNKENREALHIPSMEAIYQAMVVQNNVLSKQRARIGQLEAKAKLRDRKRVLGLLNVSRMVDDIEGEQKETDVSKITDDFLSLNLKKFSKDPTVEELQESVAEISFSNSAVNPNGNMSPGQSLLVQRLFDECQVKHLNVNKTLQRQGSSPPSITRRMSPKVASSSMSTTITSETSRAFSIAGNATSATVVSDTKSILGKTTFRNVEDFKVKSPSTMTTLVSTAANFSPLNIKNQTISDSSTMSTKAPQIPLQNNQALSFNGVGGNVESSSASPAAWVCSTCKTPESSQPVSTESIFAPKTTNSSKGFSFAPLGATQMSSSFSPQSPITTVSQPVSSVTQPFVTLSKTFTFTTTAAVTTAAPTTFTSSFTKTETPKSLSQSSLASTPFKTNASESGFGLNISASPGFNISASPGFNISASPGLNLSTSSVTTPTNPLTSLTSLVAGIEPLKPTIESPVKTQGPVEIAKPAVSQPFIFKVPSEIKTGSSPNKESGISPQKSPVFNFTLENKQESKEAVGSSSAVENKNQFSGAFKKLSFESESSDNGKWKSVFGGTPSSISTTSETGKSDQAPKNIFSFSSTTTSSLFSTNNSETISPQIQKSIFGVAATTSSTGVISSPPVMQVKPVDTTATTPTEDSETTSPVIEVCLTPPKNGNNTKNTLEKLASSKGITITKVESPERKSSADVPQSDANVADPSVFGLSPFTSPTKSPSTIFGGSSPVKPAVIYEVSKPELQSLQDQNPEKTTEQKKEPDTTKAQSVFGGITANTTTTLASPLVSSLSGSTLQPDETTQPGLAFSLKTPASISSLSTTTAVTSTQATSTFSFAQTTVTTTTASTPFSFNLSSSTASANSTFGLSSLSSALSTEDKSKSAFSFGQQTEPATTTNIFGGFGVKTTDAASIFGNTPTAAATGENKNVFGQSTSSIGDTKGIFGQTPPSTGETNTIFGQTPSSTTETKSIFGGTPATTSETKSIFGAPATTSETKSIFGTPTTTSETKTIFGTPATTTETKSIFGTPATTSETKSIFGQAATTENKSIFGLTPSAGGEAKPEFSFSLSTPSTVGQTSFFGTPATNTTSFFGQQICSPVSTASSPFGQSTTPSGFGSAAPSPFGSTPTFGQSGGSLFTGQSGGGFGSSGGAMFGGGFGSSQQTSPFGTSPGGSGSIFGGGSFSAGGQSVGQTGFGSSAFQSKPAAFGSTSPQPAFGAPPAFGAAPTFGGSPAFGSPPKLFGSPAAPPPAFGGSQQQSSTFENLASQNTMTFGNLAQNQTPPFGGAGGGSMFGGGQQQQSPPPAFAPATTSSSFGGSSFTSWR